MPFVYLCGAADAKLASGAGVATDGDSICYFRVDTMETISLQRHPRAAAARLARKLDSFFIKLLLLLFLLACLAGGVSLLLLSMALGWFVMSLAVLPCMVLLWQKHGLKELSAQKGGGIGDRLEGKVLGRLPAQPSPADLAVTVMQTTGGQFFAARFGIGPNFLSQLVSQQPADIDAVWQKALERKGPNGVVGGEDVVVALVSSIPNSSQILAQLQLDLDDIRAGADWYKHLGDLIEFHKRPKRTGGIARDWSFGYIPLLTRFGVNISDQLARGALLNVELESHQEARDQIIQLLTQGGRQNVALVGALGVGKTTVVEAFAEYLLEASHKLPSSLQFRQVISLDPGALISQAGGRGELEGLVNQLLIEAFQAKNVILCLDNAQLFFEEGVGSVDLSNVLLPVLEGGAIRMILAMDEQRWLQISQRNPQLATTLNRVVIQPPSQPETMRILQDQLIPVEYRSKVVYMYQSLTEAYRLSERYIKEQAMPGKALKLLTSAANYAESGLVTARSVQQAIEKTTGVKVGTVNGGEERDRLLNMEGLIHERMINQTRAVTVVSDALRRARAGVRNQERPIGTFLFLGPTGVGKTELSKALAAVYFGGEDRLVRVDLNEYVQPNDVARLIADAATDSHSLTAQVSHQPFSVVLLDEIEKAHPNVLNALLQVLDEGMLRDINNKEVSFRDAIIIATSNAGADRIRQYIEAGYNLEQFEKQFVDELIDRQLFRPEFLNRYDEIVVFRPLTPEELLQVVDLIINSINKNLALQKVSVSVDEDAKRLLVEKGYDPRLGARPMRRIVQRGVENLVAKRMLEGNVAPGETIEIHMSDIQSVVDT